MPGELIKVCTARPRPSVQNSHSKGHEYWRKDAWHVSAAGSDETMCGRDCSEYLRMGPFEDGDLDDFHLCDQCERALT